jgi:superfamily II DNA or RNA helicase
MHADRSTRPRLRRYQIDDLNKIIAAFNGGTRRVLYQSPTGSGKTVLFSDLIQQVADAGERALVLGHRDEIVQQVSTSLRDLGVRHGIIAPGYDETPHRVQVASVMTAVRHLDRLPQPTLLVIDETHHAAAATWQNIIAALPDADILGVTATPRRLDGKPLDDIFEHLIEGPTISSLIDAGWLAPVTVFTPPRGPDLSQVHIRAGDYAIDELSQVMSGGVIITDAVDEYARLCPDAPAIAFCVDLRHSKLVAEAFRNRGWRAQHVDGDTPRQQRRDLIAALGDGRIDILSNCGLISEGLDVPGVVAAILLRPTKSLALYLQMVGRALRPAPGKDLAFVLDHAGNVYRHGLPTARRRWSLHGRQQQSEDADNLIRCPQCGAINDRGADECAHCGAPLHRQREPRIEVQGRQLCEAVETPVDDTELQTMGYHAVLRWAADDDGRLLRDRLRRISRVRGYKPDWVSINAGQPWQEVWEKAKRWQATQTETVDGKTR